MTPVQDVEGEANRTADKAKKAYSAPRLERFGTIRELTLGAGKNNQADGQHPPGLNRSRM